MKRQAITETIIFLYALLFLYTGISKLMDFTVFKEQLSESPLLASLAPIVAIVLPWTEFLIVALLIVPRWRLKGFYAAAILMSGFTLYVIGLLGISDKLPCSCGGIVGQLSWKQHLILNSSFIILAIVGIILQKREKKTKSDIYQ